MNIESVYLIIGFVWWLGFVYSMGITYGQISGFVSKQAERRKIYKPIIYMVVVIKIFLTWPYLLGIWKNL